MASKGKLKYKFPFGKSAKLGKGLLSFPLPLTTCENRCVLSAKFTSGCYAVNNPQEKINKGRIERERSNLKLIRSDDFVRVCSKEIFDSNRKNLRWLDVGDLENFDQLKKIFQVCKITSDTTHGLFTQRDDLLFLMVQKNIKIPENLNIILSHPEHLNLEIPEAEKDFFKNAGYDLTYERNTTDPEKATCRGSTSGECGTCRDCYKKPQDQDQKGQFIMLLHGKNSEKVAAKLKALQNV